MFKISHKSNISKARTGVIKTPHGELETPFFMPDATRAVLKMCTVEELEALGLPAMVVNTYHLYLQPGTELIKKAGGVHQFMNWNKPLLSDSGGFQVFSLLHKNPELGSIKDDEVEFKSPLDGSKHILTPEKSIQIQFDLGTDMIVVLDDCPPHDASDIKMKKAIDHTVAWAKRCRVEFDKQINKRKIKSKPLLFGVVQGGLDEEMRRYCAEELIKIGFDGYGFGARPVDTEGNFIESILEVTADAIPEDKLRFGLGIGAPDDIVRCVRLGWDMFDCVIPTREGRHGRLFYHDVIASPLGRGNPFDITQDKPENVADNSGSSRRFAPQDDTKWYNTINIKNSSFKEDFTAINPDSTLKPLREYTKAYLHHLFKIGDPLGQHLASLHNIEFYTNLMKIIKNNIKDDKI